MSLFLYERDVGGLFNILKYYAKIYFSSFKEFFKNRKKNSRFQLRTNPEYTSVESLLKFILKASDWLLIVNPSDPQ